MDESDACQRGFQQKTKVNSNPNQCCWSIKEFVENGVPLSIALTKHPLLEMWTFWYRKLDPGMLWQTCAQRLDDVDTVEDFWGVYNYLEPASNLNVGESYLLFKKGISPDWADPLNIGGGRIMANIRMYSKNERRCEEILASKKLLENMWKELLLLSIGADDAVGREMINGVSINVKKDIARLAVWVKHLVDEKAIIRVSNLVKERLQLWIVDKEVYFQEHEHQQPIQK